jgi:hypothetical protein
LDRRLGGPQSHSGCSGEEKNAVIIEGTLLMLCGFAVIDFVLLDMPVSFPILVFWLMT